jgi:peptidoglycan/xylan/chitin deacetylase (PgdA/CDA1 family)
MIGSSAANTWRPTRFIAASFGIHAGALVLSLLRPALWPWALGAVLLNQATIAAAGLWPRSTLLGSNKIRPNPEATRRREVALTFDDGPDPEVTPRVLDILAAHGVRATFFCIGERAAAHAAICRAIVERGHRIENHGQRHPILAALSGVGGWTREVGDGLITLEQITGRRPSYYRPMAGLRNPFLDPVLHRLGISLASWTRRAYDTQCSNADTVLKRLTRKLEAGDVLLLHDGHSARNAQGRPVVLDVLPRLLAELAARDLHPVPLD